MLFTGQDRAHSVVPARSGRRHLLHIVHQMLQAGQTQSPSQAQAVQTSALGPWLAQAQSVLKRRSAVFVVSDFISPTGWEKPLAQLARRHEVVAVRLRDPLEMAWPDNTGMLLVQDPQLLLLDEPVAGMTDAETEFTAELFKSLARKHSLMVVEHDMGFVGSIADHVTVLHQGSVLAEGSLEQVQSDERVIEVYLGR
jgi:uncharacterized protein (DUF58 family)